MRYPNRGATVCPKHGGNAPQVVAKAAVRAEVTRWGLDDETVDPGTVLLRLVAQSSRRVASYSAAVQRLADEHDGDITKALTSTKFAATEDGGAVPTGEYTRAMVELEERERDRCANFCKIAIAAGLAERQVRMAEQFGAAMAGMVHRALDRAGVPQELRAQTMEAIAVELQLQGYAGGLVIEGNAA